MRKVFSTLQKEARKVVRHITFLPLVAVSVLLPGTADAKECDVQARDAYFYAVQRGHRFDCGVWYRYKQRNISTTNFAAGGINPLPSGEISCFGKKPRIEMPLYKYWVYTAYFNRSGGELTGPHPLENGWTVKSYTATGAQFERLGFDATPGRWFGVPRGKLPPRLINFRTVESSTTSQFYDIRLKTIKFTKPGGRCRNILAKVFGP